ncbi:hypothetical protein BN2127_JRS3_02138 [Bacillus safensis]|uniref:UPF0223 family protein n=1 Tax=Bacillus safensis TaxID=561879 RepID=UPI0006A909BE|nr:UPF0223 family protein [Bacillus safensis]CUB20040.1 hypothetical protein BN2127_JRS3_02138 [Bacillus safensis]
MEYQYPMDVDWTTEEKIAVISFFQAVEKAYEKGIAKQELLDGYKRFKEVVPSKAEEKTHCAAFEKGSGYSPYRAVKTAREAEETAVICM